MIDIYKAGDFTSGKMGQIFKNCFKKDFVVINHKQFGNAYLVDESIIRTMAVDRLQDKELFVKYQEFCTGWNKESKHNSYRLFGLLHEDDQKHFIEDFFEEEFHSWFEILQVSR